MFDRASKIDERFRSFLKNKEEVQNFTKIISIDESTKSTLISMYESALMSRLLDLKARDLRKTGESFYTIGSSGHEGMAAVSEIAELKDMAFLHYRDASFLIHRSKKNNGETILFDMMLSFTASALDPISGGRHKVLGSESLFIPPQTSTIASHLPKAVGAALSIDKREKLELNPILPKESVIITTFGDASFNHASSQAALNTASWYAYQDISMPIVFICEDNGIGISVKTPQDWIQKRMEEHPVIKYFECNGLDLIDAFNTMSDVFEYTRKTRKPSFVRFKTVRLMGHAGSDVETVYRSNAELEETEENDPILYNAKTLIGNSILSHEEILEIYDTLKIRIDRIGELALKTPKLKNANEVMSSLVLKEKKRISPEEPTLEAREKMFGSDFKKLQESERMSRLISLGLQDILLRYKEALIFGEDVALKGGVYNATAGLYKKFGEDKVFNTLLDETSILGNAIGLAHNGFLPIPEIQFLAYVHNAEDQIRGEASTLNFFSNTKYTNGMVVRIAGLGYQKGFGGHFHNDNSLAIFRDIPGVIIATPSNGHDAVLMMRSAVELAYEYGRVVIFIEPIALYQEKDLHVKDDNLWAHPYPIDLSQKINPGEYNVIKGGNDLCIVSYANGFYMSLKAKKILEDKHKISPSVIDLRWHSPLDYEKLAHDLKQYKRILIVDECRETGSLSEELITKLSFTLDRKIQLDRLCSKDSFIPLADAANLVLLQVEDILESSLSLMKKGDK